jgi:hypothetical protein
MGKKESIDGYKRFNPNTKPPFCLKCPYSLRYKHINPADKLRKADRALPP